MADTHEDLGRTFRMPLAKVAMLATRDGVGSPYPQKDGAIINGYIDRLDQENLTIAKRPGWFSEGTITLGGGNTTCLGVFTAGQYLLAVFYVPSNTIYVYSISGIPGSIAATQLGSFTGSGISAHVAYDPSTNKAMVKTFNGAAVVNLTSGTVTQITNANYPTTTTAGCGFLDGYFFVMDTSGVVWNSNIDDATTWTALAYIKSTRDIGNPTALVSHLGYIFAFGSTGFQGFYDAGVSAPASPLNPVPTLSGYVGMAGAAGTSSGASASTSTGIFSQNEETLFFLSTDARGKLGAHMLSGTDLRRISTPAVDRILEYNRNALFGLSGSYQSSSVLSMDGHTFFIAGPGLVYDATTDSWSVWTSYNGVTETPLVLSGNAGTANPLAIFPSTTGTFTLCSFNGTTYLDGTNQIQFRIITDEFDNSNTWKFVTNIDVVCDKSSTSIQLRYSDDDYNTVSPWYTISLGNTISRSNIYRLGRTRRRSFEILHSANVPLRLERLDITYNSGLF